MQVERRGGWCVYIPLSYITCVCTLKPFTGQGELSAKEQTISARKPLGDDIKMVISCVSGAPQGQFVPQSREWIRWLREGGDSISKKLYRPNDAYNGSDLDLFGKMGKSVLVTNSFKNNNT